MTNLNTTMHKTIKIVRVAWPFGHGLDIFYREAGSKNAPTILLLHGFPTSSHMFRNLIPALADEFHLIAPDYPGFGASSMPKVDEFEYSFDKLADIVEKLTIKLDLQQYFLYVMDYGAPVGYRLASKYPNKVLGRVFKLGDPPKSPLKKGDFEYGSPLF
ncbi:MAG: alpha/beta fold hydrolase [Moorea sp. SIO1G6]|uniref:alpha/beta fold hydrolase n=1 Tax=Moorena sp. SIO1G6 TaxID=2607840 RepID=UPI0013C0104C|nr:alpha/beta fold hydrolase [Moorena sp. SIO1G6]NET64136.1 alpha/beta fold hydrolase [Moorena sp. SIO1G6]